MARTPCGLPPPQAEEQRRLSTRVLTQHPAPKPGLPDQPWRLRLLPLCLVLKCSIVPPPPEISRGFYKEGRAEGLGLEFPQIFPGLFAKHVRSPAPRGHAGTQPSSAGPEGPEAAQLGPGSHHLRTGTQVLSGVPFIQQLEVELGGPRTRMEHSGLPKQTLQAGPWGPGTPWEGPPPGPHLQTGRLTTELL